MNRKGKAKKLVENLIAEGLKDLTYVPHPDGDGEKLDSGRCHCGAIVDGLGTGHDVDCPKCGAEYNSSGQELRPSEEWADDWHRDAELEA